MKRLILIAALAASPVLAQEQEQNAENAQLPSENACNAVRERVQLALGQADRALQAEKEEAIARWSGVAASYSEVYAAFCADLPAE